MQIDPDILPEDPATLQQMLRVLLHQQGELNAENDKLKLLVQRLTRQQFGRRSEQLTSDQLQFGLEDLEQTIAENQAGQDATQPASPSKPPKSNARPATTVRCLPTCRATKWSWMQHPRCAHAAAARCTPSANSAPSSSTWCPPSCACG